MVFFLNFKDFTAGVFAFQLAPGGAIGLALSETISSKEAACPRGIELMREFYGPAYERCNAPSQAKRGVCGNYTRLRIKLCTFTLSLLRPFLCFG
jgi:hypothetical protein